MRFRAGCVVRSSSVKLSEALRLKPGQEICFGDNKYTARCTRVWEGEVLYVTPSGGIKVRVTDMKPWYGPAEYARRFGNEVRWVPYHHIIR
jgi:hypothetical protein